MKYCYLGGLATMGILCFLFAITGTAQTVPISPSSTVYQAYKDSPTPHNDHINYYSFKNLTVFIGPGGNGTAVGYSDLGKQHWGYATTCPQGDSKELYNPNGAGNQTSFTFSPTTSNVGTAFKVDLTMTGYGRSCGENSHSYPDDQFSSFYIYTEQPTFINQSALVNICQNSPVIQIADYFQGGVPNFYLDDPSFTSPSITSINPAVLAPGQHKLYAYRKYDNGTYSANIPINVIASTPITFSSYPSSVCANSGVVNIQAFPKGGTWAGMGIDNNGNFDPSKVGVGAQDLTYSYIDPNKNTNPIGCTSTKTITITVKAPPIVSAGSAITVCYNGAVQNLSGTPTGGLWSGTGVSSSTSGSTFDPKKAGVGTYTLSYTYSDPSTQCSNVATLTATVKPIPLITVPADSSVCINAPLVKLSGTPTGGTWSGTGVTNNSFNASTAGVGTFLLTYIYQDQTTTCSNAANFSITVKDIPKPVAPATFAVCFNANPLLLQGATPAGGVYSGDGVKNGIFNPGTAGIGNHTITYSFKDPNVGCTGYTSFIILVKPLPYVYAGTSFQVCVNGSTQALSGQPTGGTWSGTGTSGSTFNPANSGPGRFTLSYSYQDPSSGCSNTDTISALVFPLPQLNVGSDTTLCQNSGLFALKASPTGGAWSGTGVFVNNFDPREGQVAVNVITYTYTNANGCKTSASKKITVLPYTPVTVGNPVTTCINSGPYDLTKDVSIQGGIWSGRGVNGGFFNPSSAGVGTFALTYTYQNTLGCVTSAQKQMTVLGVPGRVIISGSASGCNGTVATLYAQADSATDFQWYHINDKAPFATGATLNYTINSTEALYCVGVNQLGCGTPKLGAKTVQVISLTPHADLISSQTAIPFGGLVQFTASNNYNVQNYQWSFGDGGLSTEKNPSHYYYQKGSFRVSLVLTSPEGCQDSVSLRNRITVGQDDSLHVSPGQPRPGGIDNSLYLTKVYPSPFSDHVYIICHLSRAQKISFMLYDTYGRLLRQMLLDGAKGDNKFTIPGMDKLVIKNYYLVILKSDELNELVKILKM